MHLGFNKSLSINNNHILRTEPLKWWIIGGGNIELDLMKELL